MRWSLSHGTSDASLYPNDWTLSPPSWGKDRRWKLLTWLGFEPRREPETDGPGLRSDHRKDHSASASLQNRGRDREGWLLLQPAYRTEEGIERAGCCFSQPTKPSHALNRRNKATDTARLATRVPQARTERHIYIHIAGTSAPWSHSGQRGEGTGRQAEVHTERNREKQTDNRQTEGVDRQAERERQRQRDRERQRQRDRDRETESDRDRDREMERQKER